MVDLVCCCSPRKNRARLEPPLAVLRQITNDQQLSRERGWLLKALQAYVVPMVQELAKAPLCSQMAGTVNAPMTLKYSLEALHLEKLELSPDDLDCELRPSEDSTDASLELSIELLRVHTKTAPVLYSYEHDGFPQLLANRGSLSLRIADLSVRICLVLMLGEFPSAQVKNVDVRMAELSLGTDGATESAVTASCFAMMWQRQVEDTIETQIRDSLETQLTNKLPTVGSRLAVLLSSASAILALAPHSGTAVANIKLCDGDSNRSALCEALGVDEIEDVEAEALANAMPQLIINHPEIFAEHSAAQSVNDIIAKLSRLGAFDIVMKDAKMCAERKRHSLPADANGEKPFISPCRAAAAHARRVSKQLSDGGHEVEFTPEPFRHTPEQTPEQCSGTPAGRRISDTTPAGRRISDTLSWS